MAEFPSEEWLHALENKLNNDLQYREVARNWEGDVFLVVHPAGDLEEQVNVYLDLWHGECRQAYFVTNGNKQTAAVSLSGKFDDYLRILGGELHPMQAMLTRRLNVQGNMGLLMRNVPTVLDFVRCAREVTDIPE